MNQCAYNDLLPLIYERLSAPGLLLQSGTSGNPMTIGWGATGIMWRKNVFSLMVRHSRYSHDLLDKLNEFVISIPAGIMKKEVALCGVKSGRDTDKIKLCNFTLSDSQHIGVPFINEMEAHIECRIIHRTELQPGTMPAELIKSLYPRGDIHTFFHGEVLGSFMHE